MTTNWENTIGRVSDCDPGTRNYVLNKDIYLSIRQDLQTDPVTHLALNKWVTGPIRRTESFQSVRLRNSWSQLPFPHASSWREATALYFYLVLICLYVTEPTASLYLSPPPLIHPFPFNHGVAFVHCCIFPRITFRAFHIYTELVIPSVKIGPGTGESIL